MYCPRQGFCPCTAQQNRPSASWISNDGLTKKELDHIITRHIKVIKSYRVHRGLEAAANTDHHIVVASVAIQPQFQRRKATTVPLFNVQRLRDDNAAANEFSIALQNKFDALVNLPDDVDAAWAEVMKVYHSTASEIIGFRKFRKQLWLTDETLQVLEDKATARKRHDISERKRLQGVFRAKAKEDREQYYNNLADEVKEG